MHGDVSTPSCCAFIHRFAFEEVPGHRVLIKSGPGNRGRSACSTTHVARLEFPREPGLILTCARKARNPFQTTQGNRLSCHEQEGRRGTEEAVPGPSVFPLREPGLSENFGGRKKAVRDRFALQGRTGDFPLDAVAGKGLILQKGGNHVVFLELQRDSRLTTGDYRLPLLSSLGSPNFYSSARESWGLRSSHCRAKETSSRRVSRT